MVKDRVSRLPLDSLISS